MEKNLQNCTKYFNNNCAECIDGFYLSHNKCCQVGFYNKNGACVNIYQELGNDNISSGFLKCQKLDDFSNCFECTSSSYLINGRCCEEEQEFSLGDSGCS